MCDYLHRNGIACIRKADDGTRCRLHSNKTSHSQCACGKFTPNPTGRCSGCNKKGGAPPPEEEHVVPAPAVALPLPIAAPVAAGFDITTIIPNLEEVRAAVRAQKTIRVKNPASGNLVAVGGEVANRIIAHAVLGMNDSPLVFSIGR